MPQVRKQTPRKKKATKTKRKPKKESVLDRVAPVNQNSTGIKLLVYGRGKTGKTRFACSFPKPLLLIGTEDGTKSINTIKGIDFVRVQSTEEVGDLTDLLKEGKYASVVLDTAGGIQDLALKEVLGLEEVPTHRSWGMAKRGDWHTSGSQVKERARNLLDLSETHNTNVVIIAHERNFGEESEGDSNFPIFPTVGAALTPSVAGWLDGAVDYIGQTYIREEVKEATIKLAGKKKQIEKKTGKMEYALRVGPHPVFKTGFRLPIGAVLPESIVDPSYEKIMLLIEPDVS